MRKYIAAERTCSMRSARSVRPFGNVCWKTSCGTVTSNDELEVGPDPLAGGRRRYGLVQDLGASKTEPAREPNGLIVVGRHFENGPAQPGGGHAAQRLQKQSAAQPPAAPGGSDADVLDGPEHGALAQRLDGAAGAVGADEQPGRLGDET